MILYKIEKHLFLKKKSFTNNNILQKQKSVTHD